MTTITAYSPYAADVQVDPYPFYAWLREDQPAYYNDTYDFWALSRHADVVKASRHPELFSSAQGVGPDKSYGLSMITNDPPTHTRLRKLVHKAFTPMMINRYTDRIQTIIDDLLDDIEAKGEFDLIDDFAIPLPVTVIAEILGIPAEDQADFKRWSDDVIHFIGGTANGKDREHLRQSWNEFRDYFNATMAARRNDPRDDVITALVQAHEDQDMLSEMEILNFCQLLLVAGNETTTNLIANMMHAFHQHPEQWANLREQPDLVNNVVEEVLRYDSPIQLVFRTTTEALTFHGETIPAESKVAMLWGSANRDNNEFDQADRFDITRTTNRHIAFGSGIHYCLGSSLARLEARLTVETLLRRMPRIALAPDAALERVQNPLLRGLTKFPMVVEPQD